MSISRIDPFNECTIHLMDSIDHGWLSNFKSNLRGKKQ